MLSFKVPLGITIIQKGSSSRRGSSKTALVLAGGAISGGTFKVGGLKALNDFLVNRKVTDFDIYVGVSAGALLAVPLAGGIGPEEVLKSLDGKSERYSQLSPLHVYWPNVREFVERPIDYLYRNLTFVPGILYHSAVSLPHLWESLKGGLSRFLSERTYSNFEAMIKPLARIAYSNRTLPSLSEAIPSGIFDNWRLERYLRKNMERNRMPNSFRLLKKRRGKSLYVIAMDLDSAERVVFGPDERNDVTISEAVQASCALPLFYKPARIRGVDFVDGSVARSTNMDVAIRKEADLIICYNPFRPFSNRLMLEYLREEDRYVSKNQRLSHGGLFVILNQVFRTFLHSRIRYFMEQLTADPKFKGDVILIEPKEDDSFFFEMNPLSFWNRAKAARHGFLSVRETIESQFDTISKILSRHGIRMTRRLADLEYEKLTRPAADDAAVMRVLADERLPSRRLHAVG